mmetsp:Transcript_33192/g.23932  ORF Transcript_33192/g.23932 Transcript_33192/m.23932 type:complete len:119 (-) Transcript_33192:26-382(-)
MADQQNPVRPLADQSKKEKSNETSLEQVDAQELVFIHGIEDFIEKQLGIDESIIIKKSSLVAFTDCVKISYTCGRKVGPMLSSSSFIQVTGPGCLYLETSQEEDCGFMENFKAKELTR